MSNKRGTTVPVLNGPVKGAAGAGAAAGNPKASMYIARLSKIYELMDEVVKDTTGRQAYEQLHHALQQKTQEVEEAKRQAKGQREELEAKIKGLESNVAELQSELSDEKKVYTRQQAAYEERFREFDGLQKQNDSLSAELSRVKQELGTALDKLRATDEEMREIKEENTSLTALTSGLKERAEELDGENRMLLLRIEKRDRRLKQSAEVSRQLNESLGLLNLESQVMCVDFHLLSGPPSS